MFRKSKCQLGNDKYNVFLFIQDYNFQDKFISVSKPWGGFVTKLSRRRSGKFLITTDHVLCLHDSSPSSGKQSAESNDPLSLKQTTYFLKFITGESLNIVPKQLLTAETKTTKSGK